MHVCVCVVHTWITVNVQILHEHMCTSVVSQCNVFTHFTLHKTPCCVLTHILPKRTGHGTRSSSSSRRSCGEEERTSEVGVIFYLKHVDVFVCVCACWSLFVCRSPQEQHLLLCQDTTTHKHRPSPSLTPSHSWFACVHIHNTGRTCPAT